MAEPYRSSDMDVHGELVGIKFGVGEHKLMHFFIEDDECFYPCDLIVSAYWIDDFIDVLQRVKKKLNKECE